MKRPNISTLFVVSLASLFSAGYASAQADHNVTIHNISGQDRRVCMYKDKDTAMASPVICLLMSTSQKVEWDRKGDRTYFRVKAQRLRGKIYETVSFRRLPGNTANVNVTSRGIGFVVAPPAPIEQKPDPQKPLEQMPSYVSISNKSGEAREVCVYRADDPTAGNSIECFQIYNEADAKWYRAGDRSNFRIRTFDPTSDDKMLDDLELPGGTTLILLRKDGKLVSGGDPRKKSLVVKFRLKACNQRFDEKISFALSFENHSAFITEGWWDLEKGKCVEIQVSEQLKQSINLVYGELPRAYFYARTHGDKPQFWYWSGTGDGKSFCIDEKSSFNYSGKRTSGETPPACTAAGQKTAAFRRIVDPKADEEYYYLNF